MSQRTDNVLAPVATLLALPLDVLIVGIAWHIAVDMVRYSAALAISAAPAVLLRWLLIDYGNDSRKYGVTEIGQRSAVR